MAFFLSVSRIIKFSFQDIFRNIWLSVVTIMILILTLFSVNLLLAVKAISAAAVDTIKNKIDISLYLKTDAPIEKVTALKTKLLNLPNVGEVIYVSQEEALMKFQEANRKDPKIAQALRELTKNPLAPSLIIRPKSAEDFEPLIGELNRVDDAIIESRDFDNYKIMLEKIDAITKKVSEAGLLVSAIFILITLMVIYNTSRVAIYTHRNEIGIMRLVGASNTFIKAPFLISSMIYTLFSLTVVVVSFYLFLNLLQPYLETFFSGYNFNILAYFSNNFARIFGFEFFVAAAVNLLASWLAVSKYSNV
ncbi:MAG: permease-like cell division protein FtsX [Patescibacteria group bacterium]|nr:permease-like cell division protein FtsX [Patescibacteria group bacterium]